MTKIIERMTTSRNGAARCSPRGDNQRLWMSLCWRVNGELATHNRYRSIKLENIRRHPGGTAIEVTATST